MFSKILPKIKNNFLAFSFITLGLFAYLSNHPPREERSNESFLPEPKSVDTYIPQGFVLVPIEVSNADSLASLVGEKGGVVDLYLTSNEKQKGGLKIGSRLKILRAPLNPQQYAVLVKDSESSRILSHPGPFIAVVQNPDTKGSQLSSTSQPVIRVEYQN
jgi:hypothetical protein